MIEKLSPTLEWRKDRNTVFPRHCVECGRDTYGLNEWNMYKKKGDKAGIYSITLCELCDREQIRKKYD